MCSDFLTKSYDIGGVVSVMALSSLFILMTSHKIEYPNFYEKLYALLVPSVFVAKHRAKFFQVCQNFFMNRYRSLVAFLFCSHLSAASWYLPEVTNASGVFSSFVHEEVEQIVAFCPTLGLIGHNGFNLQPITETSFD